MPNPHKIEHGRGTSWKYTYRVQGRMVRKRTRTKTEAVQGLAAATGRTASGSLVVPADGKITLAAYSQQWLAGLRIRYSTRVSYESQLRRWILPALGDRPLTSLTRQDVLAFLAELDRSGLAPRTGNGTYRVLSTVLRSAVYDELLVKSPCYRMPLLPEVPRKLVLFTPAEATALLAAARPQDHGVLALTLGTGMRQGEALGLRLPNVRLLQRELTVDEQSRVCPGGVEITRELKTAASRRVIPLPPFAVQAVVQHIERFGVRADDGLLFRNPRDTPWRRGSFNDSVWKPTLRRAGLPTGYGFHALRHTYASSLIAAGVHARIVQARLGHKSIVETMDTYGHLFPDAHEQTSQALEALYGHVAG